MKYAPENRQHRMALAAAILKKLRASEFVEDSWFTSLTNERVFSRLVKDRMYVVVYTSIVGNEVREVGADAIRIAAVYRGEFSSRGLFSDTRVNRTGEIQDIVDRMVERMRNAWRACQVIERCNRCGAPKFVSKNGNKVCVEVCWTKANN